MSTASSDYEVIIVGAGPVGLSAGLQLGRLGVRTLILERRGTLSQHPKAAGVHARTMEIFRTWHVADKVRAAGLPAEEALGFGWMTRINGVELGRIMLAEEAALLADFARQCPEMPCFVPQDKLEVVLLEALDELPVHVDFSSEVIDVRQDDNEARVSVLGFDLFERTATFVIAADGVRSPLRRILGVTETADPTYGESVNVYFESAQLDELRAGRPYLLWWVVNPEIQGAFWPVSHEHRWVFNFEGDPNKPNDYYDDEFCTRVIRAGAGAEVDVRVLSVLRWAHESAVNDQWRCGRVFFAGDSAHRFPPHGGFGMNSGIQDAQNLAWKLAAVVHGAANDALLDSYEMERKPVAEFNARQCQLNTVKMEETGWLPKDKTELDAIERPEGAAVRERISQAIPKQREQFFSQGQQFGYIYESSAVASDGKEPERSTVDNYVMTAAPGARSPHIWLIDRDDARRSTIDLLRGRFVLLAAADGADWKRAADDVKHALGLDLDSYVVGPEGDLRPADDKESFERAFGVSSRGVVLVRPDGHVGWRSDDTPSADSLTRALRAILALDSGQQNVSAASIVAEALGALEALDEERYFSFWADDGRLELPVAPPGMPSVVEGKDAIRKAEEVAFHSIEERRITGLEIHSLEDPSYALAEFTIDQRIKGGGEFNGRFCILFGAKDGKLVLMREYFDSLRIAEAMAALAN